jgi:hypothetical protein
MNQLIGYSGAVLARGSRSTRCLGQELANAAGLPKVYSIFVGRREEHKASAFLIPQGCSGPWGFAALGVGWKVPGVRRQLPKR